MRYFVLLLAASLCVPNVGAAQTAAHAPLSAPRIELPTQIPAVEPSPAEPEPDPSEYEPPPAAPKVLSVLPRSVGPSERKYRWPLWRILTGSALVVGGGVMFGFGMSAFAFDGICVPNPPPGVECRRYYDTKTQGIALTTGGVLTAVGGLLLISIPSKVSRPKPAAQLLLPGLSISLSKQTD
ncbi:MAG TPA: hypothetical protein PKL17_07845 [Pseudomonadota bacterium]|nr:hypothetical protein [Pseudomonadota bacterium]HNK44679.1 hypothetical protein [Pseudomonadota bacterium]HNN50948.1 hypothetical protein [Pseudomonadota bacterium]